MDATYKNEIKNELNRAYRHFGDYDEGIIDINIKTWLERIEHNSEPTKTIIVDGKEITGIAIDIAVAHYNEQEITRNNQPCKYSNVTAIIMFISNNTIQYIAEEYECYEPHSGTETEYGESKYRKTTLDDHVDGFCTIWA